MTFPMTAWAADGRGVVEIDGPLTPEALLDDWQPVPTETPERSGEETPKVPDVHEGL